MPAATTVPSAPTAAHSVAASMTPHGTEDVRLAQEPPGQKRPRVFRCNTKPQHGPYREGFTQKVRDFPGTWGRFEPGLSDKPSLPTLAETKVWTRASSSPVGPHDTLVRVSAARTPRQRRRPDRIERLANPGRPRVHGSRASQTPNRVRPPNPPATRTMQTRRTRPSRTTPS